MEHYLRSIGCRDADLDLYVMYLEDAGIYNSEDLLIKEPSMDELYDMGIVSEDDRQAIYYACHPEEVNPNGPIAYRAPSSGDAFDGDGFDEAFLLNCLAEMNKQKQRQSEDAALLAELGLEDEADPNFDKAKFSKAQSMLEFNNTTEFVKLIADMDVNMIDPTDKNTLLHWATSFNNAKAVQALIDRNAAQTPNKYGKTPVELAMDACDGGDSSYFNVRSLLAVHWQKLRGKA